MTAKKPRMVADPWRVMSEAVEAGVAFGLRRADKHADDPLTPAQIARVEDVVYRAVIGELSERFLWPDRRG